jgi:hypothetical protein
LRRLFQALGLLLGVCGPLAAAPTSGPAGNFVINNSTTATSNAQEFNVRGGTVTQTLFFPYLANGQCVTVNATGKISSTPCGSGAASIAVTTGVATGFNSVTSSPTAVINFDSSTFTTALEGGATVYIGLLNSYLTASSAAATYLQLSSATATYLQQSSATATYLQLSSATAYYVNVSTVLAVVHGGTGVTSPGLVAGTNITSITGTWPNQTINAATQSGGGGGGFTGLSNSGSPLLTSSATFLGGTNVTLSQTGSTITINATAGSTVLQSSGVAFGSPTNVVIQDTNSFTWNRTAQQLSLTNGGTIQIVLTSTNVSTGQTGWVAGSNYFQNWNYTTLCNSFSGNCYSIPFVFGFGGTDTFYFNSDGRFTAGNLNANRYSSTIPSLAIGTKVQQQMNNGGAGNLSVYGLMGNNLFTQTNSSGTFINYDLFGGTQTFTGQNNWTTPLPSTFTYGLVAGSITVNGAGNGSIVETISGSTYTVTVTSTPITGGHCVEWGGANYSLVDSGANCGTGGGGTPATPFNSVQYNNAGAFGGSSNFQFNGTSVTVVSSMSVTTNGVQNNITPGLLDVYSGNAVPAGGQPLFTVGSTQQSSQFIVKDQTFVDMSRYGAKVGHLLVGQSGSTINQQIQSDQASTQYVDYWNGGEMDLQTATMANGGRNIVFKPNSVSEVIISSLGVTVSTSVTVQGSMTVTGASGLGVTYNVNAGSYTGAGLGTCGDGTHALGFTSTSTFTCQTLTGGGGSGSSFSLAVATGTNPYSNTNSSSTVNTVLVFNDSQFTDSYVGTTNYLSLSASSVTLQGNTNVGLLNSTQSWTGGNTLSSETVKNLTISNLGTVNPLGGINYLGNASSSFYAGDNTHNGVIQNPSATVAQIFINAANGVNFQGPVTSVSSATINGSGGLGVTGASGLSITYGTQGSTLTLINSTSANTLNVSTSATGVSQLQVVDTVAVAPSDYLLSVSSASGTMALGIQNDGHIVSSGTVPTVANNACGSTSQGVVDGNSTDFAGFVTAGTVSPASCAITFAYPFSNKPICVIADNSTAVTADISAVSTTGFTASLSAGSSGIVIYWICVGAKG